MDTELVNPYIAGAPVTETRMFFGREDVFDWIQNSLVGKYADHILVIHGQRRVGKTSVLKQLGNRLPKRYIPVFFDLQGRTHTTLDRFLWWLAREIARVLKQDRGLEIPIPDKDSFAADPEYFESHFLPSVLSKLDGGTLLLTFDEFDNLEEKEIKETLSRPLVDNLRRLMSREGLNFIFSIGSSGRKLENMQADYTEFFKSALYKKISFLTEEQTHDLITRPVEGILEYDKHAVNRIYKISGGHPYFTQLTCHELFAGCQRTGEKHIKEKDVESVLEDVVERGTVNLKFVWDEASDLEKWTLASLAVQEKTDHRAVADCLKKERVRFSDSDLTSSLLHLREKDVITPENRFVIHLLKLWLQKNRPIEQVREELTEINPIANRYIEIGQEFKNSGQYEKAIESFRQALAVSAGNIQAQTSVALVYMDQKAYDKAVAEFEKALTIDDEDVTARSGLCEAHLALGNAAMQKGRVKEAAQSYQRVLAINEEHTEARQHMAEIHRQRAEKALLTEGRDEDALNAFADAMKLTPEDETLTARVEKVRAEKKEKIIAAQIARSQREAGAKNWEAAIRTLEEAKSLAPDDPNILKRLEETREKQRESKLSALRTKAHGAEKAERFGEAVNAWRDYLALEPKDRAKVEEQIARLGKLQEQEKTYDEAQEAITEKNFDKAISLLKQVIVQDENFKDSSRLLTQAIELRRSARPARLTLPVANILKGLLIVIGIAALGFGGYYAWNQWGKDLTNQFATGQQLEKVCFIMTGMDDARSYWNSQISQGMETAAAKYELETKIFVTSTVRDEYEAKLTSMIETEQCDLILGNGEWLKDSFFTFAKENPYVKFSLIDVSYEGIPRPLPKNLIEQTFNTFGSGYLAGYLAAGLTKTGNVGTFGADESISVKDYMEGFVKGVESYNDKHGTVVQSFGFDIQDGSGLFAGGYDQSDVNKELHSIRVDDLINNENVDIIFIVSSPEAGSWGVDTAKKYNDTNGTEIKIIGADVDWAAYYSAGDVGSFGADESITSAIKNFDEMVGEVIRQVVEDTYQGETIEGNVSNLGVGLSPFNESKFAVPYQLKADLAQLQQEVFGLVPSVETASLLDPAVQIALDTIDNEAPLYQTTFDDWDTNDTGRNAALVNGKLILTSEDENGAHLELSAYPSDSYAVEFELSISGDSSSDGHCVYESGNGAPYGDESNRVFSAEFHPGEDLAALSSYVHQLRGHERMVTASFDKTKSNVVRLVVLGDQITAFINGQFAYTAQDPAGSAVYLVHGLAAYNQVTCEFDHFKYWDLRDMDSAVKSALATLQSEEPLYQTSFDAWESWDSHGTTKVENGKLIVTSENQQHAGANLYNLISDKYAVQFDLRVLDISPEGHCIFETSNDADSETSSWRTMSAGFFSDGQATLAHYIHPDRTEGFEGAIGEYDLAKSNTVTLIILGDQIAAFIDENLAYTAIDPDGSAVYTYQALSASYTAQCEYDNFKIWDLRGFDPAILTALAAIQSEEPLYQTGFDTWDFGVPLENATLENGKLILASENQENSDVRLNSHSSDRFAIQYDLRILESDRQVATCHFSSSNDMKAWGESWRAIYAQFNNGNAILGRFVKTNIIDFFYVDDLYFSRASTITLFILEDQITVLINGKIIFTTLDPDGSVVYTHHALSAYGGNVCEYDNYKYWDLSEVDFSAATSTTRPTSSFASILGSVADKTPDYEDDFSNLASGWPTQSDAIGETGYQDGAYFISAMNDCYGVDLPTYQVFSDFVLEMDTRFINQGQGTVSILYRNNGPAHYGANLSPLGWVGFHKNVNDVHIPLFETEIPTSSFQAWDTPKHMTLIARQNQMAIYVNGEPYIAFTDSSSSQGQLNFSVCGDSPLQALIDNLKIWDIADLSP
jgi:basic membrane lipoprotein Med (substrate-binding protein (PBP1-ABC) superfamily)